MDIIKELLRQEMIAFSEGEKQNRINDKGGRDAVNLRIAEQYITEFGNLAKTNNSIIIPTNLADIAGMIKSATSVIQQQAVAES